MTDTSDDIEVAADRDALTALERVLPRVSPPADLFDRILAEIRPDATVIPLRTRARRPRAIPVISAFVAVAAVIVIAILALGGSGLGPADARAAIAGKSDPAVTGEAALYGSTADGGSVRVTLHGVPPAPSGHHYEIWVLRRNTGAQMESVGSFTPTSHTVKLKLPLPGAGDYTAVDISVQENGGSPLHSNTSLAGGAFS